MFFTKLLILFVIVPDREPNYNWYNHLNRDNWSIPGKRSRFYDFKEDSE
jgi:hypothetical protein